MSVTAVDRALDILLCFNEENPRLSLSQIAGQLDLYLPKGSGPFPVVLIVYGGAFLFGDKADEPSKPGTDALLEHGYAVANLNYRLSGEAKAPAQIQDIKTAVRWLRAHAKEYNLNPDQQFSGKPVLQTHDAPDSPESLLIDAPIQTRPDLVKLVNTLTYISSSASPFLIQHGTEDTVVPVQQSELLYEDLKVAIGADRVTLTLLNVASHGGGPQFWDPANVELILHFLDKFLK
jgi:acetyl esterase/lipase